MTGHSLSAQPVPSAREQWLAWSRKELPPVERVREGVWSIPVRIPDHPMRYTLAYAFTAPDEVLLVDPGWDSDVGWCDLARGMEIAGSSVDNVSGVVVTHHHVDHLGLAGRVADASGAWIALGEGEPRTDDIVGRYAEAPHQLRAWGLPEELAARTEPGAELIERARSMRMPGRELRSGESLDIAGSRLQVLLTPGHSAGHVCLIDADRRLVFTGDHILPRVSSHVPYVSSPDADPIGDYLTSLALFDFDDSWEACPAHEYRFAPLAARIAELTEHTRARSREVADIVARQSSLSVWEIAKRLTWSRGWDSLSGTSLRLALGETAGHLRHLALQGGNRLPG